MAFEALDKIISNGCEVYSFFNREDVEEMSYYLTRPGGHQYEPEVVKLGVRCQLKNGERYGNIIAIPFKELCRLVEEVK